jgi:phage protein U
MNKPNKSVEEQLAAAQAEIARLTALAHDEQIRKARFPWENPDVVREQQRMGYNFKFEPELYLKAKWITENVGGMKSLQVILDRAANKLVDELLEKHGAK